MTLNKLSVFFVAALFFGSCQETGPGINFIDVLPEAGDTSYIVSPVPVPQPRNVVLEEFTGVTCANCPYAHEKVKSIKDKYGDRFIPIGLYKEGLPNFTGPVDKDGKKTKDDFRTPVSDTIDNGIYDGEGNNLPIGGIDRVSFNNKKLLDRALWVAKVDERMNIKAPVNLEAVSAWSDNGSLKVRVTATFTEEVNGKVYYTAGILQDDIIDCQLFVSKVIADYEHEHVFRGLINANGINGKELENGGVYEKGRTFVFNISISDLKAHLKAQSQYLNTDHIKPEKCKVFVFVHAGTSKEILQAVQVDM